MSLETKNFLHMPLPLPAPPSPPPLTSFSRKKYFLNEKLLTVPFLEVSLCKLLSIISRWPRCIERLSTAAAHGPWTSVQRSSAQTPLPPGEEWAAISSIHEAPKDTSEVYKLVGLSIHVLESYL